MLAISSRTSSVSSWRNLAACFATFGRPRGAKSYTPQDLLALAEVADLERINKRGPLYLGKRFSIPHDSAVHPPRLRGRTFYMDGFKDVIRAQGLPQDIATKLDALNFVWNLHDKKWIEKLDALYIFKELNGHLEVPQSFSVPHDSADWPKQYGGMNLGWVVKVYRHDIANMPAKRKDQLDKLGFVWDIYSDWDERVAALTKYKALHGHACVPLVFDVPESPHWPKKFWGMKLGHIVKNTRHRSDTVPPEYVKALNAIGFDWSARNHYYV
ncbi:Aste57867_14422 [Aphanomyces stellatus]|uniref:Aste57867_14422 protein n=1 Tax=Aphanomyces stellatus TaxID=120398 RepID=A0A485L1Q1_9STRA|nr:hypothetical protein As57867_014368 [Aphanomyces stellatus]VFT91244.1 Aste57867_14422 [Aphanomyces stellatus]